jgi:hypothetical protein
MPYPINKSHYLCFSSNLKKLLTCNQLHYLIGLSFLILQLLHLGMYNLLAGFDACIADALFLVGDQAEDPVLKEFPGLIDYRRG